MVGGVIIVSALDLDKTEDCFSALIFGAPLLVIGLDCLLYGRYTGLVWKWVVGRPNKNMGADLSGKFPSYLNEGNAGTPCSRDHSGSDTPLLRAHPRCHLDQLA